MSPLPMMHCTSLYRAPPLDSPLLYNPQLVTSGGQDWRCVQTYSLDCLIVQGPLPVLTSGGWLLKRVWWESKITLHTPFNTFDIHSITVLTMYFELLLTPSTYIAFDQLFIVKYSISHLRHQSVSFILFTLSILIQSIRIT